MSVEREPLRLEGFKTSKVEETNSKLNVDGHSDRPQ